MADFETSESDAASSLPELGKLDAASDSDVVVLKNVLNVIIKFVKQFHWLHNFPMTEILLNGTLQKLPKEWKQWFTIKDHDINALCDPTAVNVDCPSLKDYLTQCHAFNFQTLLEGDLRCLSYESILNRIDNNGHPISKPFEGKEEGPCFIKYSCRRMTEEYPCAAYSFDAVKNDCPSSGTTSNAKSSCPFSEKESPVPSGTEICSQPLPSPIWKVIKQTNPKKKHETEKLSQFMLKIKKVTKSPKILDIGSGLGYVDLFLHMKYGYKILGIESSQKILSSAVELRDKCIGRCCGRVEYVSHHLDKEGDSLKKSAALINEFSSSSLLSQCRFQNEYENSFGVWNDASQDVNNSNSSQGSLNRSQSHQNNFEIFTHDLKKYRNIRENDSSTLSTISHDKSEVNLLKNEDCSTIKHQDNSPCHTCNCLHRLSHSCHNLFPNLLYVDMMSLHSCGDLSPLMLKLFMREENISSLTMVSCCYHKMKPVSDSDFPLFQNFPLSQIVQELLHAAKFSINAYGLRLASEEPLAHWRKRCGGVYEKDVQSLFYRSILQNVCEKNGLILTKLKRRTAKKSSYKSFEEYIDVIMNNFDFRTKENKEFLDRSFLEQQLNREHLTWKENYFYLGFIRALQLSIQPVLESLVLIDRVVYLRENGLRHSGVVCLFDENVSPRNKAIFAFKNK